LNRSVVILGIDPGSRATGWGVIRAQGRSVTLVGCGVIRPGTKDDLSRRLLAVAEGIEGLVLEYEPTQGAIEDVFVSRDPRSALKLGQARGAALAALARRGLAVKEYPPALVKRAVTGSGRADKKQVARMVEALLRPDRTPARDASDALAVALCHLRTIR
jgi:crossover junction endodeoxyribonuclease RuvC